MDEIAFYNRTLTASEIVALKDSVKCDGGLAPTQVSSDVSSVNENKPVQTLVGLLSALDQDSVDAHVFQLVPGAGSDDNASVEVYRNQLRLTVKPDFETKSQYSIQIRVTDSDGNSFEQPMTVSIIGVAACIGAVHLEWWFVTRLILFLTFIAVVTVTHDVVCQ